MKIHAFYTSMDYKYAMENLLVALTPYENFLFALKAKESKRQYPKRFEKFLYYLLILFFFYLFLFYIVI